LIEMNEKKPFLRNSNRHHQSSKELIQRLSAKLFW
jgi:hypothetical protein